LYRFPDLNLLEQIEAAQNLNMSSPLSLTQELMSPDSPLSTSVLDENLNNTSKFGVGVLSGTQTGTSTSLNATNNSSTRGGVGGGSMNMSMSMSMSLTGGGGKLTAAQRRTGKWLYPAADAQFTFYICDLVNLLDLPKKSGLLIENPDFRMGNLDANTSFLYEGQEKQDAKLQEKYKIWCGQRVKQTTSFGSSGRSCPPRTRLHAACVHQQQWRLSHA